MTVKLKKITSVYKAKVYTEEGNFLGEVEDALISGNKIYGWKIKILDENLAKKGIKGLIIQHQLVKAMGQIWIVSKVASSFEETKEETGEK